MIAQISPLSEAVFEQNIFQGDGKGVFRVTLCDSTGSVSVSLWISGMNFWNLNCSALELLWSGCDSEEGRKAGAFAV